MKLDDYLQTTGISYRDMANKLSVSYESVRRYATGQRIPQNGVMQKITQVTNGQVTANDFYQPFE